MNRSVTYSVVSRKKPGSPLGIAKFYAQAQARGEADIRSISDHIQQMCTVTRADVMAVLVSLESAVRDCLANGEIVRLGELGSLQISLSSEGTEKPEDFVPSLINKSRILFRPGQTLADMQRTLKFERVEKKPKKGAAKGEAGEGTEEGAHTGDPSEDPADGPETVNAETADTHEAQEQA